MANDQGRRIPESKRAKFTGRGKVAPFIGLPRSVLESPEFGALSAHAVKLAIELAHQFRGHNNGDFSAAWKVMQRRGWRSPGSLQRAKRELLETGFAIETRKGHNNMCSLFALTWWAIDECKGKHLEPVTVTAPNLWKNQKSQSVFVST